MAHTRGMFDVPPLHAHDFDVWRFNMKLIISSFDIDMWDIIEGDDCGSCKDRFDYLNPNALSIITNALSGKDARLASKCKLAKNLW